MGRPKGSTNRARAVVSKEPSQAEQLLEALSFVSVAKRDDLPYQKHVILNNGCAIVYNGQMAAGFPIVEGLACCPQLDLLKAAIVKCGQSLSIAELQNRMLSVKGDKIKAMVPCLPFSEMPDEAIYRPDPNIAAVDDRLKKAFEVCGVPVSEAGKRMLEAAVLLEANQCTGTDGKVLLQYWHGIDLPPDLLLPKIFTQAVCKTKSPVVGFGWSQGRSITLHFESGAWIKTQLYEDKYPSESISGILNVQTNPIEVPQGLFDAIATCAAFNEEGQALLEDGRVVSSDDDTATEYEVDGLDADVLVAAASIAQVAPFVSKIDLKADPAKLFFFGENVRGCVTVCVKRDALSDTQMQRSHVQLPPHAEQMETWRANGSNPDEIPF